MNPSGSGEDMSINKIGSHRSLVNLMICIFILLVSQQNIPAGGPEGSADTGPSYRVKKSGRSVVSNAREDFEQLLREAKRLYNEMDYEGAIQKLTEAKRLASTSMQKADFYFYLSLVYYASTGEKDRNDLDRAINNVLTYDYSRELDKDLCPSQYIEIFQEIKAKFGTLKILSHPSGADVYLGAEQVPIGKTPLTIGAKAGSVEFRVQKGKSEKQDALEVFIGQETTSPIYDLAGKKGKFPIALVLAGAAIAGGAAAFALKGGGGNGGGVTTGSIQVNSSPSGARIYLDGADTGKVTNTTLTNIAAGSYIVKLAKDGYSDKEQSTSVTAGQTATVNLTLTKDAITVSQPTAGATWVKGSSVEINWQVSAGSSLQSESVSAGSLGTGLQNQHRFNAQYLRAARNAANTTRRYSRDLVRTGGGKSLGGRENLREPQRVQGPGGAQVSENPQFISGVAFPFSPNLAADHTPGLQTRDTARVLIISDIKIELYKGTTLTETIVSETENDGSYTWQVSSSLANGSDYKVRVSCSSDANVYGESSSFSIWTITYEFVTKWGSLGSGNSQFSRPRGVAVDSAGYVYVGDSGNSRIQKFTSIGKFVKAFGQSIFSCPGGIAIDNSGNIYVADLGTHSVQKFTSDGAYVKGWGGRGSANGQFGQPEGIAVDSSGNVYVADFLNYRVQKFNSNGTFLTKWGSQGSGDSQFAYAYGIAVDHSGNVYVADSENNRIQKFTSTGMFLAKWGSPGTGDREFYDPFGIAVDSSGFVYVADSHNHRIQKFTSDGTFITKWGSKGSGNGQFLYPWKIAIDSSGYVYVTDYDNNRIQKFRKVG